MDTHNHQDVLLFSSEFIRNLFSDMPTTSGRRGRGSTGSSKIKVAFSGTTRQRNLFVL